MFFETLKKPTRVFTIVLMVHTNGYLISNDRDITNPIPLYISLSTKPIYLHNNPINNTITNGTIWYNFYGGSGRNEGGSVIQTPDNGFLLTGKSWVIGPSVRQSWIVKTDSEGEPQWMKTYPDKLYEIESIILTNDNRIVFTGMNVWLNSISAGLAKIDSRGSIMWNQTYADNTFQMSYAVVETADGGFLLTGSIWPSELRYISWIAKTNASGTIQWERTYDLNNGNFVNTILTTGDTDFTIVGSYQYNNYGLPNSDVILAKMGYNGTVIWNKTYGGNYTDEWISEGIQTTKGDFLLVGTTHGPLTHDVLLVKTDIQGNLLWHRTYGGKGEDNGVSIVETSDGNYIILGYTNSFGSGGNDIWLIKTNANGQLLWEQTYGGVQDETGSKIIETNEENLVFIGTSYSPKGDADVWLVNVDPSKIIIPEINPYEVSIAEISSFNVSEAKINLSDGTVPSTSGSIITVSNISSSEVSISNTSISEISVPNTSSPEFKVSEISTHKLFVIVIFVVIGIKKVRLQKR